MADNHHQLQADDYMAKLYADVLTRRVNRLDTRLSREQRESSDRTQGEGGRNNIVRIDLGVENIEKKLNDAQEIIDAVSDLTRSCSNGNPSHSAVNHLRTLKTSIMKSVRNALNASCELQFLGTAGAEHTTTSGTRRRLADAYVERAAPKRRKTRHGDNGDETSDTKAHGPRRGNTEAARTTPAGTKRERDVAQSPKRTRTRHNGGEQTRTAISATNGENANSRSTTEADRTKIEHRKSLFAAVVVKELNRYYHRGVFATVELFSFMARTIVHRLMDSTHEPDDDAVKSTILHLIPREGKITSKNEILNIIRTFY